LVVAGSGIEEVFVTGGGLAVGAADELAVAAVVVGPSLLAVVTAVVDTPVAVVVEVDIGVVEAMGTEVSEMAGVMAVGMVVVAAVGTPEVAVSAAVVVETLGGIEGCTVVTVDEMVVVLGVALTVEVAIVGPAAVIVELVVAVASVAGDVVTALAAVAVVVEAAVGTLLVGWVAVGVGFESQYVGQFVSWMPPMILGCFSAADVGSVLALSRGLRTWCPTPLVVRFS